MALTNDLQVLLVSCLDLTPRPNLLFSSSFSSRGAHQKFSANRRKAAESILANSVESHLIPEDTLSRPEARVLASWLHLSTIPFDVSAILSTDLFPPIDRSFLFEKRPHFPSLFHSSPYFSLSRVRRNFVTEIKIAITRGTRGSKFREVFRSRSAWSPMRSRYASYATSCATPDKPNTAYYRYDRLN